MKGYVRKRGSNWSFTVDVGKDPITGKRKQKTKSGFKTKKEAESALNDYVYQINRGTLINPKEMTVRDFALEWYESTKFKLRETTAEQYMGRINNWIIPNLGQYKLLELKPIHVQAFSRKLLESLEQSTANKVIAIAKMIVTHAVNLELIYKNPFTTASAIKNPKRKVKTWSFQELDKFLNIAQKHSKYYDVFFVAAYTGMRKGEILGLRKTDIDFANGKIFIKQNITETKKGLQVSDLKTSSSYRQVAIDTLVASILKERIKKNNELKLKTGSLYQDHGLVFCHEDGTPYRPTSMNRPFKRMIEMSGVPQIRFHDLRHTHATLLLEMKVNPKIVADRLGHSSVKITLDTYSHASLEIQSEVADLFAERAKKI